MEGMLPKSLRARADVLCGLRLELSLAAFLLERALDVFIH